MRALALATLVVAFVPAAAWAQAGSSVASWPAFARDTPYRSVRPALIRQGFDPVPVRPGPQRLDSGWPTCPAEPGSSWCRAFPEVKDCSAAGLQACLFLFRRRADGQLMFVSTAGEDIDDRPGAHLAFRGYMPVGPHDLDDVIIAIPGRADRRPSR